jgi:excisionase family DNA binding protein
MELNGHRIFDTAGVMDYTHACRSTVYAMLKTQGFPAIRLGRKLLVRSDLLDRWPLENCSASGKSCAAEDK